MTFFSGLGFWDCEFAELKARGFGIWIGKQRKTRLPYSLLCVWLSLPVYAWHVDLHAFVFVCLV